MLSILTLFSLWNAPVAHACSCGGGKIEGEFDIKSWVRNFNGAVFTGKVDKI